MSTAGEVVREACRVIWTEGQVARVPEFYAEDFEADYPMTDWGSGLAGVATLAESVRKDLPGYAEHIDELVEAGDEVVVRLTITGTDPRTGVDVSFRDVTMLTVRDGKIIRQRGLTDYLSLYLQLGLVQMPGITADPSG
jgi:ketosteroid isomerase-like protein